jgi:hypothetical protein
MILSKFLENLFYVDEVIMMSDEEIKKAQEAAADAAQNAAE